MKKYLITALALLVFFSASKICIAQKAYENVSYSAKINGSVALLTYADGYIGASYIMMKNGRRNLRFEPVENLPESTGSLSLFIKRSKASSTKSSSHSSDHYFILKNVDVEYEAPDVIKAVYIKEKAKQLVQFRRLN